MEPLLPEAASKEAEQLSWGGGLGHSPLPRLEAWQIAPSSLEHETVERELFLLLIPAPLLETRATVESRRAAAGRDHSSLDGGDNHHGQPDQDHHLHRAKFVLPINLYQLKT